MSDFIKAGTIILSTFFVPIHGILIALTYVIVFDLCTGLLAAYRTGSKFNRNKFLAIVPKIIMYNLTIVSVYLLDIHLLQEFINYITKIEYFSTKIVGTAIFLVEFNSVIQNLEEAFNIRFFKFFQRMKKIIGKEASDVSKITSDMNDTVNNVRNMGKDPVDRANQNYEYQQRSLRYGRRRNQQNDDNMPI